MGGTITKTSPTSFKIKSDGTTIKWVQIQTGIQLLAEYPPSNDPDIKFGTGVLFAPKKPFKIGDHVLKVSGETSLFPGVGSFS